MILSLVICIALLSILVSYQLYHKDNSKDNSKDKSKEDNSKSMKEPYCSSYRSLNMSSGESSYKCGCPCVSYGNLFDYKARNRDQTYGVPNGCQKMF